MHVSRAFVNAIRVVIDTIQTPIIYEPSPIIASVIITQNKLEVYNMVVRFIAIEWSPMVSNLGVENPQTKADA